MAAYSFSLALVVTVLCLAEAASKSAQEFEVDTIGSAVYTQTVKAPRGTLTSPRQLLQLSARTPEETAGVIVGSIACAAAALAGDKAARRMLASRSRELGSCAQHAWGLAAPGAPAPAPWHAGHMRFAAAFAAVLLGFVVFLLLRRSRRNQASPRDAGNTDGLFEEESVGDETSETISALCSDAEEGKVTSTLFHRMHTENSEEMPENGIQFHRLSTETLEAQDTDTRGPQTELDRMYNGLAPTQSGYVKHHKEKIEKKVTPRRVSFNFKAPKLDEAQGA